MKVKHIITTCGVIIGGLALTRGASATLTYVGESDVQFTFASTLSMTVDKDFTIEDLVPDTKDTSNEVTVGVTTTSSAGYELSATVGNSTTYTTTDLVNDAGVFSMIDSSATTLTSGKWGLTLDDGTSYKSLDRSTGRIINKTTNQSGTAATGYSGGNSTKVKIGAYATAGQVAGDYKNVVNFTAVANVAARTVTVAAGDNVASVTPSTAASYNEGSMVNIAATCADGYTFTNWSLSADYGKLASETSASTTYTVGPKDVTITAYCMGTSS